MDFGSLTEQIASIHWRTNCIKSQHKYVCWSVNSPVVFRSAAKLWYPQTGLASRWANRLGEQARQTGAKTSSGTGVPAEDAKTLSGKGVPAEGVKTSSGTGVPAECAIVLSNLAGKILSGPTPTEPGSMHSQRSVPNASKLFQMPPDHCR